MFRRCVACCCAWLFLTTLQVPVAVAADEADAVVLLQRRVELLEREAAGPGFAAGTKGTVACPAGFRSIMNERACKQGNEALKMGPWRHKGSWALLPKGCFLDAAGDVYLNSNASGKGKEAHVPICEADSNFAAGSEGKTNCPPGFRTIDNENACRQAKNALSLGLWQRKDSWPNLPGGCFTDPAGDLFLNSNASGLGKEGHAPVCEKAIAQRPDTQAMYAVEAITLPDVSGDYHDGDYVAGTNGTDACPEGYQIVDTEGGCRQAKNALNLDGVWRRKDQFWFRPFGCSADPSGDLYLNTNESATAQDGHSPICQRSADGDAANALSPVATDADSESQAPAATDAEVAGIDADISDVLGSVDTPAASVPVQELPTSGDLSLDDMAAEIVRSHSSAAAVSGQIDYSGQLGASADAYGFPSQLGGSDALTASAQLGASADAYGFPSQFGGSDALTASAQLGASADAYGFPSQLGGSDALTASAQLGASADAYGFPSQLGGSDALTASAQLGASADAYGFPSQLGGSDALTSSGQLGASADALGFPGQLGASDAITSSAELGANNDALGASGQLVVGDALNSSTQLGANNDSVEQLVAIGSDSATEDDSDEDTIQSREREIIAAALPSFIGNETDEEGQASTDADGFEMIRVRAKPDLGATSIASVPVLPGAMEDRELAIIAEKQVAETAADVAPEVAAAPRAPSEPKVTNSGASWQP